jgi:hypothetical protein
MFATDISAIGPTISTLRVVVGWRSVCTLKMLFLTKRLLLYWTKLAYNVLFQYLIILCDGTFSFPGMNYWELALLYSYLLPNKTRYVFCKNKCSYLYVYLVQACLKRDVVLVHFYVLKFYRSQHCFI